MEVLEAETLLVPAVVLFAEELFFAAAERPEVELFVVDRPAVVPLDAEALLLPEVDDLLPPEEGLLREALVLPDVVLLSLADEPLAVELPLLPVDEVLEEVDLSDVPLPVDAGDFDALLEAVLLVVDSLLELLSLGVPPVERLAPLELPDEVERPLVEVLWLEVFFVCPWLDRPCDVEVLLPVPDFDLVAAIIMGFMYYFKTHAMVGRGVPKFTCSRVHKLVSLLSSLVV